MYDFPQRSIATATFLLCAALAVAGCEDDPNEVGDLGLDQVSDLADDSGSDVPTDPGPGDSDSADTGRDAEADTSADADDSGGDSSRDANQDVGDDPPIDGDTRSDTDESDGLAGCIQASVRTPWDLVFEDDVSIRYDVAILPAVETEFVGLTLLFERYSPGADVGTFDLGAGPDANFGTCAHCVVLLGLSPERAFYADRGTLVLESDPYRRRIEGNVSDLRLVEVTVDPVTRVSSPVPGGTCVEVADFSADALFPPDGWTCPSTDYDDGTACHCTCGAYDPDCADRSECPPFDPDCETREELPVVDCDLGTVCSFDPLAGEPACVTTCDWGEREACEDGVCMFDFGVGDGDSCIAEDDTRNDSATFGESCGAGFVQRVCNTVDGFALGYCGPSNVCRPVCDEESDCVESDESCRRFIGLDGLGYCGPEPEDG